MQIYKAESYDDEVKAEMDRAKKCKKPKKEKELSDKAKADKAAKLETEHHLKEILSCGVELFDGPIIKQPSPTPPAAQPQKNDGVGPSTSSAHGAVTTSTRPSTFRTGALPASTPVGPMARLQPSLGQAQSGSAPNVSSGAARVQGATLSGSADHRATQNVTRPQAPVQSGNTVLRASQAAINGLPGEFLEKYNNVHRALYGKLAAADVQMPAVKVSVDKMCDLIGIPGSDADNFEAVNVALHRAASAVGC